MANPVDSRTLADVAAAAVDSYLPGVIDLVLNSNAVWIRLASRERIILDGGDLIRQPIWYRKTTGSSYSGLDTFDTARVGTKTVMQFDWAQYYNNLTIDGRTIAKTSGTGTRVLDLVQSELESARLSLADDLGTDLFGDGTGNSAKVLLGLVAGVDDGTNVGSYGGITRDSSAQGSAVKGNLNTTGGALALALMNTVMGSATIQPHRSDLIVCPQAMWDRFWERVQASQREPSGPGFDDLARIGFTAINFNGAAVVVDSHVASGNVWFLNTDFIKLVVHQDRNFVFNGFRNPTDQDAIVGQLLFMGQLVVQAPRLQARATGLS